MSNSPLIDCKVISPNKNRPRNHAIDRLTPHCVVGQLSAEAIGSCFAPVSRQASCNYGIGYDGRVALICDEGDRSWCSSSPPNDHRAITIECASEKEHPYAMNEAVYEKLILLCADICRRYGKKKVLWLGSKEAALAYQPKADEMVLTAHRWFAAKACPGDWLYSRGLTICWAAPAVRSRRSAGPILSAPATASGVSLPGCLAAEAGIPKSNS